MKKRFSHITTFLLSVCCIALIGGYIYSLYLQNEIWKVWKQTLWEDCTNRMMEINTKTIYTLSKMKSQDTQIKSENNTHHIEKKEISPLTDDEKIFWANQLYLSYKNPVKIEAIDSLFQKNLTKDGFSFKTAIILLDTTVHKSFLYAQDLSEQRLYGYWEIDYKKELQKVLPIKGYIKGNWLETALCTKEYYLLLLIIVATSFIPLSFEKGRRFSVQHISPATKKTIHKSLSLDIEEQSCDTADNIEKEEYSPLCQYGNQDDTNCPVVLNTDKHSIIYDENEISLAPKIFNLFLLLSQGDEYFQPYDYLIQNLWSENNFIEKKHLEQLVIRLRKNLKELPILNIDTIRGSGYQINCKMNMNIHFSYIGSDKAADNRQDKTKA